MKDLNNTQSNDVSSSSSTRRVTVVIAAKMEVPRVADVGDRLYPDSEDISYPLSRLEFGELTELREVTTRFGTCSVRGRLAASLHLEHA